jgi:hypothetical protein
MWASKAPTPMTTFSGKPKRAAHSGEIFPIAHQPCTYDEKTARAGPSGNGSSQDKKSALGKPSNSSCHIALWPAAQRERRNVSGSVLPVSTAEIQSQCSTQENAARRTDSSTRNVCRILAQNHSDE